MDYVEFYISYEFGYPGDTIKVFTFFDRKKFFKRFKISWLDFVEEIFQKELKNEIHVSSDNYDEDGDFFIKVRSIRNLSDFSCEKMKTLLKSEMEKRFTVPSLVELITDKMHDKKFLSESILNGVKNCGINKVEHVLSHLVYPTFENVD